MRKEKNIDLSEDCPEQMFLDKFFQDKKHWEKLKTGDWTNDFFEASLDITFNDEYSFVLKNIEIHYELMIFFPMPEEYETFETILNCFDYWEDKNG